MRKKDGWALTALLIACALITSGSALAVFTDNQIWILLNPLGLSIEGMILILNT